MNFSFNGTILTSSLNFLNICLASNEDTKNIRQSQIQGKMFEIEKEKFLPAAVELQGFFSVCIIQGDCFV